MMGRPLSLRPSEGTEEVNVAGFAPSILHPSPVKGNKTRTACKRRLVLPGPWVSSADGCDKEINKRRLDVELDGLTRDTEEEEKNGRTTSFTVALL